MPYRARRHDIDIDDTWALALLLNSPELDLRLCITEFGEYAVICARRPDHE